MPEGTIQGQGSGAVGGPANPREIKAKPLTRREKAVAEFLLKYVKELKTRGNLEKISFFDIPNFDSDVRRAIRNSNDSGGGILKNILNEKVVSDRGVVKSVSDALGEDKSIRTVGEVIVDSILRYARKGYSSEEMSEKIARDLSEVMVVKKENLLSAKRSKGKPGKTAPANSILAKAKTNSPAFKSGKGKGGSGLLRIDDHELNVGKKRDRIAAEARFYPTITESSVKADMQSQMLLVAKAIREDKDIIKADPETRGKQIRMVLDGVFGNNFQPEYIERMAVVLESKLMTGKRLTVGDYKTFIGELNGLASADIKEILKIELSGISKDTKIFGDVKDAMGRVKEIKIPGK